MISAARRRALTGWAVGDQVCALLAGGGYATGGRARRTAAAGARRRRPGRPPPRCRRSPARSGPTCSCCAALRPAETLLIHGGASGIGTMAIQLAARDRRARRGDRGLAPTSSSGAAELGAEILVNYRDAGLRRGGPDATDGRGADVVLDNMGANYLARNVDAARRQRTAGRDRPAGRHQGRAQPRTRCCASGPRCIATTLRARPAEEKAAIVAARTRARLAAAGQPGEVRPVVDRVLPMTEAAEAHRSSRPASTSARSSSPSDNSCKGSVVRRSAPRVTRFV